MQRREDEEELENIWLDCLGHAHYDVRSTGGGAHHHVIVELVTYGIRRRRATPSKPRIHPMDIQLGL